MHIEQVETTLYRLPLDPPVAAASTGIMSEFDIITVQIRDSDGAVGVGYTTLLAGHGKSIVAIIEHVFQGLLLGEDPREIEGLWRKLWKNHHYSGRGGPVSFALAAVDTALWDLKGVSLGEPLWRLLGGYQSSVPVYAGNIDLNFPVEKLLMGATRRLKQGFKAIKMRLGKPTLREDIARVTAMREHIGPDIELMTDVNEGWRVDQAIRAFHALKDFNLVWIEEPIQPDNYAGYAHLRANGGIPIAAGENLHTLAEFAAIMTAGGIDFPEPDFTTCGGITVWMKVAHLAEAHGLSVTSHGAHDIHVHLLAAAPNASYLEYHGFGLDAFIAAPLSIENGRAVAPNRPGHGVDFDWDALAAYQVR